MRNRPIRIDAARLAAVEALASQARRFPDMPPVSPDHDGLDERDGRLALAIHRTAVQRWLTLRHLLEARLRRRLPTLEPALQGVLLAGAAQLLFMERLPAHAIVDESVELARHRIRRGAAGLVNAALRRVAGLVAARDPDTPWSPAPDRVPWQAGFIRLAEPLLPPTDRLDKHLAIATSHPVELVRAWRAQFGDEGACCLLRHSLSNPPTIVNAAGGDPPDPGVAEPHEEGGFFVWRGGRAQLVEYLHAGDRFVQDPASAAPVRATAVLQPRRIADYCAGRGTKTRQLARVHPDSEIIATDIDPGRFAELQAVFADHPRVRPVPHDRIHEHDETCDLLLLDVPCSNTGVLARRLEARYRYKATVLGSVIKLQRQIIAEAAPLLRGGGRLLYSTCSIEPPENRKQADRAARQLGLRVAADHLTLPGGAGRTYHDGGYWALLE